MVEPLAGKVAWVAGVGGGGAGAAGERGRGVGHAVALLLAAKGARVLVSGPEERSLGACVGEIAHGGGQARHVVSALASADEARACVAAARERFGGLDVAVFCSETLEVVARALDAARDADAGAGGGGIGRGGRLIVVVTAPAGEPRVTPFVQEVARVYSPRGITCNAILVGAVPPPIRAAEAEDIAELALLLAGPTGAVITGATVAIA